MSKNTKTELSSFFLNHLDGEIFVTRGDTQIAADAELARFYRLHKKGLIVVGDEVLAKTIRQLDKENKELKNENACLEKYMQDKSKERARSREAQRSDIKQTTGTTNVADKWCAKPVWSSSPRTTCAPTQTAANTKIFPKSKDLTDYLKNFDRLLSPLLAKK